MPGFDPFFLVIAAAIGLLIFMQFRNAKKRRTEAEKLQEKMTPGTEIMTNYGLFGTIVSIDEETNVAIIEAGPGTLLRIHRQSIMKAVDDEVITPDSVEDENISADLDSQIESPVGEPEFGERTDDVQKPVSKRAKKTDD